MEMLTPITLGFDFSNFPSPIPVSLAAGLDPSLPYYLPICLRDEMTLCLS